METPTNTLEEKRKSSVEQINLNRLSVLTDFRQRMVLAEKINEIITLINKFKLV
jgi:hypothetical protein